MSEQKLPARPGAWPVPGPLLSHSPDLQSTEPSTAAQVSDSRPRGAARSASASYAEILNEQVQAEAHSRRRLRRSVGLALAVHALLLAISLPSLQGAVAQEPDDERQVFVVQTPRFRPPEPPVVEPEPPPREEPTVLVPTSTPPLPNPEPLPPTPDPIELPQLVVSEALPFEPPPAPPAPEPEPERLMQAGVDIAEPRRIHTVKPEYPVFARRVNAHGKVVLQAIIDRQGLVSDLKVLDSSMKVLDRAAVEAVRQWRYEPSTVDGKAVEVMLTVTVHFKQWRPARRHRR